MGERIQRLEKSIDEAIEKAPVYVRPGCPRGLSICKKISVAIKPFPA
jgi:hypothetical protein